MTTVYRGSLTQPILVKWAASHASSLYTTFSDLNCFIRSCCDALDQPLVTNCFINLCYDVIGHPRSGITIIPFIIIFMPKYGVVFFNDLAYQLMSLNYPYLQTGLLISSSI